MADNSFAALRARLESLPDGGHEPPGVDPRAAALAGLMIAELIAKEPARTRLVHLANSGELDIGHVVDLSTAARGILHLLPKIEPTGVPLSVPPVATELVERADALAERMADVVAGAAHDVFEARLIVDYVSLGDGALETAQSLRVLAAFFAEYGEILDSTSTATRRYEPTSAATARAVAREIDDALHVRDTVEQKEWRRWLGRAWSLFDKAYDEVGRAGRFLFHHERPHFKFPTLLAIATADRRSRRANAHHGADAPTDDTGAASVETATQDEPPSAKPTHRPDAPLDDAMGFADLVSELDALEVPTKKGDRAPLPPAEKAGPEKDTPAKDSPAKTGPFKPAPPKPPPPLPAAASAKPAVPPAPPSAPKVGNAVVAPVANAPPKPMAPPRAPPPLPPRASPANAPANITGKPLGAAAPAPAPAPVPAGTPAAVAATPPSDGDPDLEVASGPGLTIDIDADAPPAKAPAARPSGSPEGARRGAKRFPVRLKLSFGGADEIGVGTTENLSEKGAFIATPATRASGTRLALIISHYESDDILEIEAMVRWGRPARRGVGLEAGMGVEFVELTDAQRALVDRFVRG